MNDLHSWRREFPIVDTCTYLVSHSLGAMPRPTRDYLRDFADTWDARGVRAWHEGWWEIGRETGNLLAPILGVAAATRSRCTRTSRSRRAIIASCFRFDGPRRKIVMTDLEFPSNHYLFEGFRRYGAEIVYVPSAGSRSGIDLDRLLDAIDERHAARAAVARAVQERVHQDARAGDREGAPGRRARHPRRLPGGRHGADGSRRAGTRTSPSAAR